MICFSVQKWGIVYILEQMFGSRKGHICCFHASTPILSSILTSINHNNFHANRTFHHIKNHKFNTKITINTSKINHLSNFYQYIKIITSYHRNYIYYFIYKHRQNHMNIKQFPSLFKQPPTLKYRSTKITQYTIIK